VHRRPRPQHAEASPDLHGNAPDDAGAALVIIDVINDLEFEGGAELLGHALPMARRLAELKRRARAAGIPAIYANDNFGKWKSDFSTLVRHCLEDGVRGRPVAKLLLPEPDDYFVLKPKHSAFFATVLDSLLTYIGAETLILTGLTGDICVLFTAADAFLRDFRVVVPSDCVASIDAADNARAVAYMARVMGAEVRPSTALDLDRIARAMTPRNA
jgi:nicotinamidase-related amidase